MTTYPLCAVTAADSPPPVQPRPEGPISRDSDYLAFLSYQAAHHQEDSAGRPAGNFRDCIVRALAVAAGIPYENAEAIAKRAGRRHNCGYSTAKVLKFARKDGLKFKRIPHRTHRQLSTFLRTHPVGHYLLVLNGHALSVVDGRVHDMGFNSPFRPVYYVWRFFPNNQPTANQNA